MRLQFITSALKNPKQQHRLLLCSRSFSQLLSQSEFHRTASSFRIAFDIILRGESPIGGSLHALRRPNHHSGALKIPFVFLTNASRPYSRSRDKHYDLFGNAKPGDEGFKKAWKKEMDEDDVLWSGSEDEDKNENDSQKGQNRLEKEVRKVRQQAKDHSHLIDADDSDELWSVWSGSDEEKTLWTGSEGDDDDDIPTEAYPNEASDKYLDKLFEFEEKPKYRTISELLKAENEPEELSPGKQARKLAVENALKKLKKGPDGRYVNVWEVMSDIDILIGAFENIVAGPEYEELRQGGPKRLNMEFFKDIQARMRDPNYKFSPELKLKPKSKLVPRKKWQKTQSKRRKAQKR